MGKQHNLTASSLFSDIELMTPHCAVRCGDAMTCWSPATLLPAAVFMSFCQAGALEASGDTTRHAVLSNRYLLPSVSGLTEILGQGTYKAVPALGVASAANLQSPNEEIINQARTKSGCEEYSIASMQCNSAGLTHIQNWVNTGQRPSRAFQPTPHMILESECRRGGSCSGTVSKVFRESHRRTKP